MTRITLPNGEIGVSLAQKVTARGGPALRFWRGVAVAIGPLAWLGGVGLAFVAQRTLTSPGGVEQGIAIYAVSVLVMLFAILRFGGVAAGSTAEGSGTFDETWAIGTRALAGNLLMSAGTLALVASLATLVLQGTSSLALPLWLIALASIVLGACLMTSFPWSINGRGAVEAVGVIAIMGVAFALRYVNLVEIPRDVHGDEGAVGIAARALLSGEVRNIFGLGWASLPQLSFGASALSLEWFGNNLFGLRLASVIQGTLSVGLLYGVTKRLFSTRAAVLAAIVLAVSQMAIHYSRIGNNYVQALFASLLLFYFLLRGLSNRHPVDFLLAGISVGLTLSVYIAARLTPALAVLYCVQRAIREPDFLRRQWRGFVLMGFGTFLFMIPQAVFYVRNPLSLFDRTSSVFVLRVENMAHEMAGYNVQTVPEVLWRQFVNSIGAFNLLGETSLQYGQRAPLLDAWSGPLFVLGLAIVAVRLRHPSYFLIASWFWLTLLLGSVLTLDALFSPHIVGALGVLAILPALVIDIGWRGVSAWLGVWGNRIMLAGVIVLIALIARQNYVDYFETHARTGQPEGFFTVLSRYVETVNDRYRVYLLAENATSLRYDTSQFLIPNVDGVNVRDRDLPLPLDRIPAEKGVVFIVRSATDPRLAEIRAAYPLGIADVHRNSQGHAEFTSYRVDHAELLAASPNAVVDHAPIPAAELDNLPAP